MAISFPFGIIALFYGQVLISVVAFFINAYYTKRFIDYTGWQQMKDVLLILFLALFAGSVIFLLNHFGLLD